jgi:hypothetical protein
MAESVNPTNRTFFNVPPPDNGNGPVVSSIQTPIAVAGQKMGWLNRLNTKTLIIIAGVVVLGLIGFGSFRFFTREKTAEPETITPDTTTVEPEQVDGVTTPPDWLQRYFNSSACAQITICGDDSDPDRDGLKNIEEYNKNTDPNNPDSDAEGISDGDEVNVFSADPLKPITFSGSAYNDAEFIKGGYDIQTNAKYTPARLAQVKANIQQHSLHQPTITTLGESVLSEYDFVAQGTDAGSVLDPSIDQSPEAKLARDTQRVSTIKKIGAALIKYKTAQGAYPIGNDFIAMSDTIRPFNTIATNYNDPIGTDRYVYGYQSADGTDFVLTYYSETQNLLIKYRASDAEKNVSLEDAQVNDTQRQQDLQSIQSALLVYSSANVDSNSNQIYVFPSKENYKTALVPKYITSIPKDPATGLDYEYSVGQHFDTFTLTVAAQNPAPGTTGFVCNENECTTY